MLNYSVTITHGLLNSRSLILPFAPIHSHASSRHFLMFSSHFLIFPWYSLVFPHVHSYSLIIPIITRILILTNVPLILRFSLMFSSSLLVLSSVSLISPSAPQHTQSQLYPSRPLTSCSHCTQHPISSQSLNYHSFSQCQTDGEVVVCSNGLVVVSKKNLGIIYIVLVNLQAGYSSTLVEAKRYWCCSY